MLAKEIVSNYTSNRTPGIRSPKHSEDHSKESSSSGSVASSIDLSELEGQENLRMLKHDAEFYLDKQREEQDEEEKNYRVKF